MAHSLKSINECKWSKVPRRTFKGSYLSQWHLNNRFIDHLFLLLCPQLSSPLPSLDIKKNTQHQPFLDHLPRYHYYYFFFPPLLGFQLRPVRVVAPSFPERVRSEKVGPEMRSLLPLTVYCISLVSLQQLLALPAEERPDTNR